MCVNHLYLLNHDQYYYSIKTKQLSSILTIAKRTNVILLSSYDIMRKNAVFLITNIYRGKQYKSGESEVQSDINRDEECVNWKVYAH